MWRVDPSGGWFFGWDWRVIDEALWVGGEGGGKGELGGGVDGVSLAVMDLVGCHQAEACMVVRGVIQAEEVTTEPLGMVFAAEAFGELWPVFEGLEVAFRERIVVGDMRPAVGRARGG